MAATKIQLNWSSVSIGSTQITGVEDFSPDPGESFLEHAADNDRFATLAVKHMSKVTATITTSDSGTALSCRGMSGVTTTATHLDAKGAVGGNIVYAIANSYVITVKPTGPFGSFSKATISIGAISSDGQTDPFSFTRT